MRGVTMDKAAELEMPSGLSEQGRKAHAAIVRFLKDRDMASTGGCKAFYSPAQWKERGEKYGDDSLLLVVYDGGEHRAAFNLDEEQYKTYDAMQTELDKLGLYFEECTGWYSAIYPK